VDKARLLHNSLREIPFERCCGPDEHGSVLGPLFQHSFDSDDHEDNLSVSNKDRVSSPSEELIVFYVNDNNLDDCPQINRNFTWRTKSDCSVRQRESGLHSGRTCV
jgi:hypothetical protein